MSIKHPDQTPLTENEMHQKIKKGVTFSKTRI